MWTRWTSPRTRSSGPGSGPRRPGGSFGLLCFRPEGGSGYTDRQVYQRASLGGGLGYPQDRLRSLWLTRPGRLAG